MTFVEVKGQQRSNVVNNALWLEHCWSEELLMQVQENDDLLTFREVKDQQRSN